MGKDKSKDATEQQKPAKVRLDGNYPSLNNVSWLVGYLEQFLTILSEPLLIMCAVIAFVDFQTRGGLLRIEFINYLWAISLGVAIDASMIMTGRRAVKAFTLNYYGRGIALMFITILLGVISWAALDVQSLQQALQYTSSQAFAEIYLSPALIIDIRSGVAIAMMVVVAVSNHTAVTTAQAPARRIEFLSKAMDKIAPKIEQSAQTAQPSAAKFEHLPAQAPAQIEHQSNQASEAVSRAIRRIEQAEQDTDEHESIVALGMIEQKMYDAIVENPRDADELLKLSQSMSLDKFTDTLKQRYSQYASYITPQRVAKVLAYARSQNVQPTQLHAVQTPLERVRQALIDNPGVSDRKLAELAGLGSGNTAKKYRLEIEAERQEAVV